MSENANATQSIAEVNICNIRHISLSKKVLQTFLSGKVTALLGHFCTNYERAKYVTQKNICCVTQNGFEFRQYKYGLQLATTASNNFENPK